MTIEQEFFETFGIVSKFKDEVKSYELDYYLDCAKRKNAFNIKIKDLGLVKYDKRLTYKYYPSITPEIVLKLAATLNDIVFSKIECCCLFTGKTVEEITNNILSDCIDHKHEIQPQVKALFNA